jgi:hypothetical protein
LWLLGIEGREVRSSEGLLCHDGIEFIRINLPIRIRVRPLNHLQQLRVGHGFAEFFSDSFQIS